MDEVSNHAAGLKDIVMVAHYGNRFDVPFLFHAWNTHGINFSSIPFKGQIDTLTLAEKESGGNATKLQIMNHVLQLHHRSSI